MRNIKQLTDDSLDTFIVNLADWIEAKYPTCSTFNLNDDKNYDELHSFIYNELGEFSNGYKNFN